MKLMYLGTAAAEGVPAVFCHCRMCAYARKALGREVRTRSGAIIDDSLKIDFPADAYMQALRSGLDFSGLRHILITHTHQDHYCAKELNNRRYPYSQTPKTEEPLTVYGNEAGYALLREHLEPGVLEYRVVRPYEPFRVMDYTVTPLRAVHAPGQTALFYLIENETGALLYAHDTDEFTQEHFSYLADKRLSLVSLDCTNGILEGDYPGHMGISDNLRMRERLLSIGAADESTLFIANHFSHNGLLPHAEMEKRLPGFLVAYDGFTVEG